MVTFQLHVDDTLETNDSVETAQVPAHYRSIEAGTGKNLNFPTGCRSIACIAQSLYSRLTELSQEHPCSPKYGATLALESRELAEARSELAKHLVHEFGHAVMAASVGRRGKGFCFMESSTAESGFELEKHVFDVLLSTTSSMAVRIEPCARPLCNLSHELTLLPMLLAVDCCRLAYKTDS